MQNPSKLRSTVISAILIVVFVFIAAVFIGALDKSQICAGAKTLAQVQACKAENLLIPGNLLQHNWHLIQTTWTTLISGTDKNGIPYHSYILSGLGLTIEFCFIAMPLAILLGLVLALMSRSKFDISRIPARAFVEFFRNTPLLVQLVAIYTGLAFLPPSLVNPVTAGIATFVLNYGAYECENLRAGIEAIDRGQGEAAATLGLRRMQTLRLIEIPQMIPIVLPPILNDLIYMYKDSSILSLITVSELTEQTQALARQHQALAWQFYVIGGILYLLLSLPLGRLARAVEGRIKSLKFNTKLDTTTIAIEVLAAAILIGIIAGLLVNGFSLSNIGTSLANVVYSIVLAVLITACVAVVLGGIAYLISRLLRLVRGGSRNGRAYRNPPASGSGEGGVTVAAAMSSGDL